MGNPSSMDARNILRYLVTLTPGQFAARCLIRLAQRFVFLRIIRVMKLELPDIDPGFLAEPEDFESGYLDREACENFTGVPANRLSQSFVDSAIDRGDTCYAFVREGVLASYGWYSDKPCPLDNRLEFHYDNEYIYMYNGFTLPRYRGHRLHAFGMAAVLKDHVDRGQKGIVSLVDAENYDSLRSVYRLGYRTFGTILITGLLGRYLVHHSEGCKRHACAVEVLDR